MLRPRSRKAPFFSNDLRRLSVRVTDIQLIAKVRVSVSGHTSEVQTGCTENVGSSRKAKERQDILAWLSFRIAKHPFGRLDDHGEYY